MMFAIALALSSALVSGAPPSAPLVALDAVTEDGALIYVARDGRTVRAMDLASGAERWQVELQGVDQVQAAVLHKLAPHRLLLQVPGRYFALDRTRGLLSSRSGPPDWTFVWRGGGACALRSPCVLQPISCDDGRALGPALHERDGREMFGERDSARPICISNPGVLGSAKGLSLYLESHLPAQKMPPSSWPLTLREGRRGVAQAQRAASARRSASVPLLMARSAGRRSSARERRSSTASIARPGKPSLPASCRKSQP